MFFCLSWFGRVAALKIKVLSRFVFIFRSLILPILLKILKGIQKMFVDFIWEGKEKPRVKTQIMQQEEEDQGLSKHRPLLLSSFD